MKKLLLIFLILGTIYLNRNYDYAYSFLSKTNLISPVPETTMMIGDKSGYPTLKYIALGDSLTAGVGVSDYKDSYPYIFSQKLSLKNNVELTNLAHIGDTTSDLIDNQLPKTLSLKPDLITLLIGVNDIHQLKSPKEFEENLLLIISTLKKSGAKIIVLSIPYLGSDKIVFFPYNLILDFRTKQFNNVILKVSNDTGVQYINLYHLNKPENFYSLDEFHPGKEGYKQWSDAINVN